MADQKHTSGPWVHVKAGEIFGPDEMPVAYAAAYRMDEADAQDGTGQASANARLIAAAPDLLALTQKRLDHLEYLDKENCLTDADKKDLVAHRAAIAKATGGA